MRAKVGQPDSLLVLKKPFDNIEVQQLAHGLTKKWLLSFQARLQIAELAQANESLALSEERFSKAFHQSPLPSAIQDFPDQQFVDVNERLAQAAGYKREEMVGRTPAELFLWEKPELSDQWYEGLVRQQLVRDQEAKIRDQAGALREMLVSLAPIALGDQPHVLLLAQDVSERALLERQLRQAQKMEAIGQLAAGVAHDFNNILTVIQGHAGLMQRNWTPTVANEIAGADHQGGRPCRHAHPATPDVQSQAGDAIPAPGPQRHLRNAIKMLERLVGEHVQIEFQPQSPLPAIHADSSMLEQIAMNLAVNARDAMPNGGRLSITTSLETIDRPPTPMDPERREGKYICLTFRDNGIGMDTQVLAGSSNRSSPPRPSGRAPGWACPRFSVLCGNTRAGWRCRANRTRAPPFASISRRAHNPPKKRNWSWIPPCARVAKPSSWPKMKTACGRWSFWSSRYRGTVLEAASGARALEVGEQASRPVDLLLTDMVMPGGVMGSELAERLSTQCPRLKVIYTSGYSPGMAGKDASLLEGRNFLPKPYSVGKLAQFVRECLDAPVKRN